MPQIRPSLSWTIICFVCALGAAGCGSSNPQATFSSESGGHPAKWAVAADTTSIAAHATAAKANVASCTQCHGEDFSGGVANVACADCHLGNEQSFHPVQWGDYAYARHKDYVTAAGTAGCATASCHGANLAGVTNSGKNCATECHMGGATQAHPANWALYSQHADYVQANDSTKCNAAACHGTGGIGVFLSGPACNSCHLGGNTAVHPTDVANWRTAGHQGYVIPGQTIAQTRARCDIQACHGTFNDPNKPGQVQVDKTCAAATCHFGDIN